MASEKTIKKFLMKARHASQLSDFPRQKLGAVMVLGNKIITDGYNTAKTSPIQKEELCSILDRVKILLVVSFTNSHEEVFSSLFCFESQIGHLNISQRLN